MKKFLVAVAATVAMASPAQAGMFDVNAWERAMIGNKCADNVEAMAANMAEVYDREAELRGYTPGMTVLKEATAAGMRARVAMETNCSDVFRRHFWNTLNKSARSDDWFFQMVIWYHTQPQVQEALGENGSRWWE